MYKYFNAHPKGLLVGDCVKRAITMAAEMDYMDVQRELNRYKRITGARAFNTDYNPHKYVENVLQAKKLSFPAVKGQSRMNGRKFCESYPQGRYILNMAGHWSCCVDGVIYDTWDCSDKCVYTAYELRVKKSTRNYKNYCEYSINPSNTYTLRIYDKDGKLTEKTITSTQLEGYIQCLRDFGYSV